MMAFEIVGHHYRTIVVGEGTKSCPLFTRSELEQGAGATTAFNAKGELLSFSSVTPQGGVLPADQYRVTRVPLPEWAKSKTNKEAE